MPTSGESNADILVGRVLRPHGLTGAVQVDPLTDFSGRFAVGEVLFLAGRACHVEWAKWASQGLVLLKLEEANSVQDAQDLKQESIFVTRDRVPPLPPDQYYHFQLLDMQVYTSEGEYLGRVSQIMETGSNDVYLVSDGTREVLIPALDDIIQEVDIESARMKDHLVGISDRECVNNLIFCQGAFHQIDKEYLQISRIMNQTGGSVGADCNSTR